jgi:hypothetical protein
VLFQVLDDKKECVGIYAGGRLHSIPPANLTKTWRYSASLGSVALECAYLYAKGQSPSEACPDGLRANWDNTVKRLKAFFIAFDESKVSLYDNCFYDLVPDRFLLEFCDLKNQISEYVFENYERPKNYDFLYELHRMTEELNYQKLNVDAHALNTRLANYKTRSFFKKLSNIDPFISYNMFGTVTGRLTTVPKSFPILTLDKDHRDVLLPNNDWFIELDFNAAELRTLLALAGKEQPTIDIHDWNVKNVYDSSITREAAKKKVFAWLYNPKSKDRRLNEVYDRDAVVQKYFNGWHVNTFFGRKMPADGHHALNYIIQSTTSDLFLRRMLKVWDYLKDKKSKIAFSIHDSLVIDYDRSEHQLLPEIISIFSDTDFGKYKVNVSGGKSFGKMKEMKI